MTFNGRFNYERRVLTVDLTPVPYCQGCLTCLSVRRSLLEQTNGFFDGCKSNHLKTTLSNKMNQGTAVLPGQQIGSLQDAQAGNGTFAKGDGIFSSLKGVVQMEPSLDGIKPPIVKVIRHSDLETITPNVDSLVIGQVTRINPRQATLDIKIVDGKPLAQNQVFTGIIRAQDVRNIPNRDTSIQIYDSFRPGDIVRAKVLSLGEARSYLLSTADSNNLGVILAKSGDGNDMMPQSWDLMVDPNTGVVEKRKCAKP